MVERRFIGSYFIGSYFIGSYFIGSRFIESRFIGSRFKAVVTFMIAFQSMLAIAGVEQLCQSGEGLHPTEYHSNERLSDSSAGEPDNLTNNQPPAVWDISIIEQCELCHGHCHMLSMGYLPDLGAMPGKSLMSYQASFSSLAPSSPFRPPIV